MQKRVTLVLLVVTSLLIVAAPGAVSQSRPVEMRVALGAPDLDPNAVVSRPLVAEAAAPLSAEEMASAIAWPLREYEGESSGPTDPMAMPQPEGPGGSRPGSLPSAAAMALAEAAAWDEVFYDIPENESEDEGPAIDYYPYAPPFDSINISVAARTWKSYPWSAMGKLYFKVPGDTNTYLCSGGVGAPRAVWTAGNCVYTPGCASPHPDLGCWHTNITFVPAYRDGEKPYGTWTAQNVSAPLGWTSSAAPGNRVFDTAMVSLQDQDIDGGGVQNISYWTGYLAFKWGAPSVKHFHGWGYASNLSSGRFLWVCAASTSRTDPLTGDDPIGMGCDMADGSAGGPRLVKYVPLKAGKQNFVNGVTSYLYPAKPLELYAAYFGDAAKGLHDWGMAQ